MKYVDTLISFSEVPDEISLCINISNCPYKCPGCHSSYLAQDIGNELTLDALHRLIEENPGISCVCLMGGTELDIQELLFKANLWSRNLKTAWYTGQVNIPDIKVLSFLDYIKVGPYIEELGPLTSETTNQRLYSITHLSAPAFREGKDTNTDCVTMEDITSKFWKHEDLS